MSNNPFSTEALNKSLSSYPVIKGDLPGHPFHGNQYTAAASLAETAKSSVGDTAKHYNLSRAHERLAKAHDDAAKSLQKQADGWARQGDAFRANELEKLAKAHADAELTHTVAAGLHDSAMRALLGHTPDTPDFSPKEYFPAEAARWSQKAADDSAKVQAAGAEADKRLANLQENRMRAVGLRD